DPNSAFHAKVVLGPSESGRIAVGLEGWYDSLEPVIQRYGRTASQIYFPYPAVLSQAPVSRGPAMMVMTFERTGLESAVASIERDRRIVSRAAVLVTGQANERAERVADETGAMRSGAEAEPASGGGSTH